MYFLFFPSHEYLKSSKHWNTCFAGCDNKNTTHLKTQSWSHEASTPNVNKHCNTNLLSFLQLVFISSLLRYDRWKKNLNFPLSNSAARIRRHKQCFWRKTGICVMATSVYCQASYGKWKSINNHISILVPFVSLFSFFFVLKDEKKKRELWDLQAYISDHMQWQSAHARPHITAS